MEGVSAAGAVVGLAVPVFQCAKALRDKIKQVASEKAELLAVLSEYEKDINLLESLYNEHKALMDQHHLDSDLKELAGIIHDLDNWLNSVNPDLDKDRLPSIKELWRAGDLREKMAAANAAIGGIRNRWDTRLNVSTLVSVTAINNGQAEMKATLLQFMSILRQQPVRQRALTLCMRSQVEPAGSNSHTTRVITKETASGITFSIISPDASLSYDQIMLRLNEYRNLLASDSDTIELPTENGQTVVCRKQATGMEQFLDQAEGLLQDIVQCKDISTLDVLYRLRDLAMVLGNLELHDECRLIGNFALDLAEALGRQSLGFRRHQAETIALIAVLHAYRPRARTLFIQAVSICDEVVASHPSDPNKNALLGILHRAGYWLKGDPELSVHWLERAVKLMTKDLPSTMVTTTFRSVTYFNYGVDLRRLKRYVDAVEVHRHAVSIRRTLVTGDPIKHTPYLARALENIGMSLDDLGRCDEAATEYKEALKHCRTVSAQRPLQYKAQLAKVLYNYGITLVKLEQFSEAADMNKEAVTLYRGLAEMEENYRAELNDALTNYGESCHFLGQHAEAVLAYQEYIPLQHPLVATNPEEGTYLCNALHNIANSFHALDRDAEADAAATEALQINQERVLKTCKYAPYFSSCFVCQRANTPDPPTTQGDNPTPPLALSPPSTSPPAESREHSEIGASLMPAENPTVATAAHTPPTNALYSLGLSQPGVSPNPPSPLDPTVPAPSYLPSSHPQIHGFTDSRTHLPNSSGGTTNVLWHKTREKFLGLFRKHRRE